MLESFITALIVVFTYFAPALIAERRWHPNKLPILIINLFFGWTLLGWVICLAWSVSGAGKKKESLTKDLLKQNQELIAELKKSNEQNKKTKSKKGT